MKKKTAIVSALLVCLLLAACAAQPAAQNALEPAAPAPTAPIVEITPSAAPAAEASAPQPTVVTQAELANLYSFTGTVEVESADGTLPAYEGMRLYAGDFLRTGAGSTASLDLDQGRLLMMDADAELQFLEKDNGTLEVYLTKGAILNRISKGQMKPYTVRAANVTMGVLGTVFRVSIDDVTGVAVTDLYEGKLIVTFTNAGGQERTYELDAGRRFTADAETLSGSEQQNELITEPLYMDDLSPEMLDMLEKALLEREDAEGVTELLEQIKTLKQERAAEEEEQNEPRPRVAPEPNAPAPEPDAPAPEPEPVWDSPSSPSDPSGPPAPTPIPAMVDSTSQTFDKNASATGYVDKNFILAPGDYTLKAIKIDSAALTVGTDYSVSVNMYTILKETLAALSVGSHTITFDMSGGTDPTVALTVTDSTPTGATVSPTTETFDLNERAPGYESGRAFTLTLRGYTLSAVTIGGSTLSPTTDYDVYGNDDVCYLWPSYLQTLAVGEYTITFVMSGGENPTATLTVTDTAERNDLVIDYFDADGEISEDGDTLNFALGYSIITNNATDVSLSFKEGGNELAEYSTLPAPDSEGNYALDTSDSSVTSWSIGTQTTVTMTVNYKLEGVDKSKSATVTLKEASMTPEEEGGCLFQIGPVVGKGLAAWIKFAFEGDFALNPDVDNYYLEYILYDDESNDILTQSDVEIEKDEGSDYYYSEPSSITEEAALAAKTGTLELQYARVRMEYSHPKFISDTYYDVPYEITANGLAGYPST